MKSFYHYLPINGEGLFTAVCLPQETGKFPVVIMRSPYVDYAETMGEDEAVAKALETHGYFVEHGYALVYQHCRGCGKSGGQFIPYDYERDDGLALQAWVRTQPFYNGEIYLCGGSYTASVHFVTAPFADDIKGAVLQKQDCDRYNQSYRNGIYRIGYWNWFATHYKKKAGLTKQCTTEQYNLLPFSSFPLACVGERVPSFEERLRHPKRDDPYWDTRYGGVPTKDAIKHANIPILLTMGLYDLYTGGAFQMWNGLDEQTKAQSALVLHPYDHSGFPTSQPVRFENATLAEAFGADYPAKWLDAIRSGEKPFVETGKVTYYPSFGQGWQTDEFALPTKEKTFVLGEGERSYDYDPRDPAPFQGGLSINWGGTAWQDAPNLRQDILTVYTPAFESDTLVKGKMQAKLRVKSSCEDTGFYLRVSLCKAEGDYGLRDDISQISNACAEYTPGEEVELTFSFDEHAFVVKQGERLRVDISSSAFPMFVRHTNCKGLFSEQTETKVARNTVLLGDSFLTIFVCEE